MNKKILSSINFLMNEFKRLSLKRKNGSINNQELETLKKLANFLGKKNKE